MVGSVAILSARPAPPSKGGDKVGLPSSNLYESVYAGMTKSGRNFVDINQQSWQPRIRRRRLFGRKTRYPLLQKEGTAAAIKKCNATLVFAADRGGEFKLSLIDMNQQSLQAGFRRLNHLHEKVGSFPTSGRPMKGKLNLCAGQKFLGWNVQIVDS